MSACGNSAAVSVLAGGGPDFDERVDVMYLKVRKADRIVSVAANLAVPFPSNSPSQSHFVPKQAKFMQGERQGGVVAKLYVNAS